MAAVEAWLISVAGNWWIHLVVFSFCLLDAFFPVAPSESMLVTLSSLYASTGGPNPIWLILAGWSGAFIGDHIAYLIGNRIGWKRFNFMHGPRGQRALRSAEQGLEKQALIYFLTSRFIPLGRTAVNFTAGALHYPLMRYTPRVFLSTGIWAVYSVLIGALAGQWFHENPLLGIVVALVVAVALSAAIEKIIQKIMPKVKEHNE